MTDNMKKWMELVSQNRSLQEKLMAQEGKTLAQQKSVLIALAKENGIALTETDFTPEESEELSDDELGAVAGGGGCGCPVVGGGGGGSGEHSYVCACIGGGGGMDNSEDYCICPLIGAGTDTPMQ